MRLACRHIRFSYPGTQDRVFQDLSLELSEPGFHALFGPSGVGKSSLAHILTGRYVVNSGEVNVRDIDTFFYTHNLERLPGWSSIGRHLDRITPGQFSGLKDELIHIFGIEPILNQRFDQLSLGQRNRVNLVRYLAQDFQMMIMDESLANVDERKRSEIIMAIKALFPDVIFLYISHNLVEVAKFCSQIWVLRSSGQPPEAVEVKGQDISRHGNESPQALEKTMLELMSAA